MIAAVFRLSALALQSRPKTPTFICKYTNTSKIHIMAIVVVQLKLSFKHYSECNTTHGQTAD